jgi:hypothetical protein
MIKPPDSKEAAVKEPGPCPTVVCACSKKCTKSQALKEGGGLHPEELCNAFRQGRDQHVHVHITEMYTKVTLESRLFVVKIVVLSAIQDISCILWNPNDCYRGHKSQSQITIQS